MAERLWDSEQTCEFLRLPSTRTLDQWAYRRIGPRYVKVGRYRRYRPEDVEAWVESQIVPAGAA